jgi:hypothetical protein
MALLPPASQVLNPTIVPFSTSDIRLQEIAVPAASLPALIGRKGTQLREMEVATGCVIDIDHAKDEHGTPAATARLKITGFEAGIAAAEQLIAAVTSQVRAQTGRLSPAATALLLPLLPHCPLLSTPRPMPSAGRRGDAPR